MAPANIHDVDGLNHLMGKTYYTQEILQPVNLNFLFSGLSHMHLFLLLKVSLSRS
jgi:hypothetical protein